MKKLFAILMAICMMASVICVPAFAAEAANELPEPAAGTVLRATALLKDGKTIEFIGDSANIETSAQYIVDAGIMAAAPAAKTALSNLNKGGYIAYLDGDDMRAALEKVYNAFGMNLIGGKLPDDGFYYEK